MVLPITLATALTGTYAMLATLAWGRLLYGIPLTFADPLAFVVAVPGCIVGLGMFGLLLASTFVLLRNANALANTLEYPIWLVSGMLVPITSCPAGPARSPPSCPPPGSTRGPRGGHRQRAGLAVARHLPGHQPGLPGARRDHDDPRRAAGPRGGHSRAGLRRRR
ncbi:hypothetical protein GCM10027614_32460 [Micromonospora vulcania]